MRISGSSRLLSDEKGTAALEFSLVAPLFLLFIFGTLEFGQGLRTYHQVSAVAASVSRVVMLDSSVSDTSLETAVRERLPGYVEDDLAVSISTETVEGSDYRIVTIVYPIRFMTPILNMADMTLTTTSRTPIEN